MKLSLRFKLISIVFLLSLPMILGTIAFTAYNIADSTKTSAFGEAKAWAESYSAKVAMELNGILTTSHELANMVGLYPEFPPKETGRLIDTMLKSTLEDSTNLLNVWVILEPDVIDSGAFRKGWHKMDGVVYPRAPVGTTLPKVYQMAQEKMAQFIAEPFILEHGTEDTHPTVKEWASTVVVPIMTKDGRMVGIVGADFGLAPFQAKLSQVKAYTSGYAELLSNAGIVITAKDPENIGEVAHALEDKQGEEILRNIRDGKPFEWTSPADAHGKESFQYFAPIPIGETSTPWSFLMVVPLMKFLGK